MAARPIRILHVSDLHAAKSSARDQRLLVDAFLADVRALHTNEPIDLIVFTGDLTFAGKKDEYVAATELLLRPLLELTGLPPCRCILVPGNHDVDRALVNRVVDSGLLVELKDREAVNALLESADVSMAAARLQTWFDFRDDFYAGTVNPTIGALGFRLSVETQGYSVGVLALNSAWRAQGGPDDAGRLLLGEAEVRQGLDDLSACDVVVAALHHPIDWLRDFDADDARRNFEARRTLVLSGHEHTPNPSVEHSVRGAAFYGRVGCLYQTRDYANSYAVYDYNPASGELAVSSRSWWPKRECFDAATDIAHDGRTVFTLPAHAPNTAVQEQAAFTAVIRALRDVVLESSAIPQRILPAETRAGDLLVTPKLLPVPYPEAVAVLDLKGDVALETVEVGAALEENQVLIVSGDRESGVTCTLAWTLVQDFEKKAERLPVYLPFSSQLDGKSLEKAAQDAATRFGIAKFKRSAVPPTLFAIDDVKPAHVKALDRLVRYASLHPEHSFVLGCHGAGHAPVADRLAEHDVAYRRIFVAPFGRGQTRDLVARLVGPEGSGIVERIFAVIAREGLPRSPFIMSVLITVLHETPDLEELNETALLNAYVNVLIGSAEWRDPEGLQMDYRRREHLLSCLAGRLTIGGLHRMSRLDVERFIGEWLADKGWTNYSPGRVLDSFIDRRVLAEDHDGVSFRHVALRHLFAAKRMLDDETFADVMLSDPMAHGDVIRHAVALNRSDRRPLEILSGAAQDAVDEVGSELNIEMFDRWGRTGPGDDIPTLEQLKAQLALPSYRAATKDLDEALDDLDDRWASSSVSMRFPIAAAYENITRASSLLSDILRNSELVDDVALKGAALRQAINLTVLVAIIVMAVERDTQFLHEMLSDRLPKKVVNEGDSAEWLDQFISSCLTLALSLVTAARLGSRRLAAAIEDVLADEEFMSSPGHALVATMICCRLQLKDWPERLGNLYDAHGSHPVVADVVRALGMVWFRSAQTSDEDAQKLQVVLLDIYGGRELPNSASVEQRAKYRGEVAKQLQHGRRTALRQVSRDGAEDALL